MDVTTPSQAKRPKKAAAAAKPAATRAKPGPKPKPKLPQQRATRSVTPAAKPATTSTPKAPRAPARAPRRPRPLVALARRSDGRPLSFVERLSERRHAQFKHPGPVCHSCRINASHLAAATGASGR